MCLAIPGKVVRIIGEKAIVDYGKEQREARLMNPEIKEGDYVVVQNKLILQSIPEDQAIKSIEMWELAIEQEEKEKNGC